MDWQDNEFEGFLKRFRLREGRPLPVADVPSVPSRRFQQWKIAAAAVLVVAVGASAAIVRQLSVKPPTEAKPPEVFTGPVVTSSQSPSTTPSEAQTETTPPVKPDPKPREPLKQLTKVMPPEPEVAPSQIDAGTVSPGQQILNTACGNCHSVAVAVKSDFETPQEYASLVSSMVGMGAAVTTEQAAVLAEYLFKTYGKKKEPEEDRGKTAFNTACGSCHSLELMDNRRDGDRASYQALVNNMNGYGAGLTPEQIDPLVDYLFRTYGRRPRA